ncbi:hypothetical protein, partial [Parvibaculum sp.]
MKRLIAIGLAGLVVLAAAGFCVIWFSPSLQDGIMKRTALGRLGSGDNSALLTDNSLHVLLCGTGSPMP